MTRSQFNYQPNLQGENFNIRPLCATDYEEMRDCAADIKIWAGHPATDRYKEEVFKPAFDDSLASGGCVVFSEKTTGTLIGWSRLYVAEDGPNDISIGYTFLSCNHWGGTSNKEIKTMLLDYAFQYFDRVWFHIAPDNVRSQKATAKLGASMISEGMLTVGASTTIWQSHAIDKGRWQAQSTL